MYPVMIESRYKIRWKMRKKLRRFGLERQSPNCFSGKFLSRKKVQKIRDFCKKNHLKFRYDNDFGSRNRTYRTEFLNAYPVMFGRYYFCAYCGRLLTKETVTVDHLYPVHKVSQNLSLQKKLKASGIKNVNDMKNLVPACEPCNKRKAAKMGIWIIRGKIGKSRILWTIRWMIRLFIFAFAMWQAYNFLMPYIVQK